MRVTLDDDAQFIFHTSEYGDVKQGTSTDMSQISFDKLQAYIAAANEAFDAMQIFVNWVDNKEIRSNRTYNEFKDILEKVGD